MITLHHLHKITCSHFSSYEKISNTMDGNLRWSMDIILWQHLIVSNDPGKHVSSLHKTKTLTHSSLSLEFMPVGVPPISLCFRASWSWRSPIFNLSGFTSLSWDFKTHFPITSMCSCCTAICCSRASVGCCCTSICPSWTCTNLSTVLKILVHTLLNVQTICELHAAGDTPTNFVLHYYYSYYILNCEFQFLVTGLNISKE